MVNTSCETIAWTNIVADVKMTDSPHLVNPKENVADSQETMTSVGRNYLFSDVHSLINLENSPFSEKSINLPLYFPDFF